MIIERMNQKLTSENFIFYAMKNYDNPHCHGIEEFYEDLNRIKYIKRLFGKYEKSGQIKERLLVNHVIILDNLFGSEATSRLLFYSIEERHYTFLKTILDFLKYLPYTIPEVNLHLINIDSRLHKNLSELKEMR